MFNEMNRKSIVSNFLWRFGERFLAQIVSLIVSIILARILYPDDYGVVALVTVFISIMQIFIDGGLGTALVQKKDADDIDFSSVFFFNIIISIVLYVLLFTLAPGIAHFFKKNELILLIRVSGIILLISGIKNVQQAYVSRNMLFRKFFYSTLGGTIISAIVGISLAFFGFGAWALVAQMLTNYLIDTLILWVTVNWRPIKVFSLKRLKELLRFGWKLLVSYALDSIYNNLRSLVIGKIYTSSDLAFYNQAYQYPSAIVNNIDASIDSVLLPLMSKEQDNKTRVKALTRRSIQTSIYIMAPLMIGLASISEPLITVLLTDKWLPAVPFLMIFCISFMFFPIHTANLNAITAMGRSDLFLIMEILKKTIGIILLCITAKISVIAMGYSLLISTVTSQIINSWPNKKLLDYPYFEQLKDIFPELMLALFMGGAIYWIKYLPINSILIVVFQVILGAGIYIGTSVVFKIEAYLYIINTIKIYLRKNDI